MDELVQWLGEQIAEDERIARAVRVPHEWHQGPGDDPEWTDAEMVCMWPPEFHTPYEQDKHWRGLTVSGEELAAFIAAHDPARVLREIEAKRATIREYEKAIRRRNELVPNTSGYRHWDNRSFGLYVALRHMVAVYADRPGYAEALAAEKAGLLADE